MASGKVRSAATKFAHANVLAVEAETNCPQGGDAGHGGFTRLCIKDEGGTSWKLRVRNSYGEEMVIEQPREVTIELLGDAENLTFRQTLEFAIHVYGGIP